MHPKSWSFHDLRVHSPTLSTFRSGKLSFGLAFIKVRMMDTSTPLVVHLYYNIKICNHVWYLTSLIFPIFSSQSTVALMALFHSKDICLLLCLIEGNVGSRFKFSVQCGETFIKDMLFLFIFVQAVNFTCWQVEKCISLGLKWNLGKKFWIVTSNDSIHWTQFY